VVTSVNGNNVTWRNDSDDQLYTDSHDDMELIMKQGGGFKKLKRGGQMGGYLEGPSHEEGGIPVMIKGGEMIEVEGTEYIINGETVEKLGVAFFDKLNATATRHHPTSQGFQRGELQYNDTTIYKDGGMIEQELDIFGIPINRAISEFTANPKVLRPVNQTRWNTWTGAAPNWEDACLDSRHWQSRFNPSHCWELQNGE